MSSRNVLNIAHNHDAYKKSIKRDGRARMNRITKTAVYISFLLPVKWMELGPDRFDALVQRANTVYKITKAEKEERYQHYRAQFKYMERRRKEGAIGWLDFVAWD